MTIRNIRWSWAIGGAVAVESALLASAFLYMVLYSYWIHPGENIAYYREYAKVSSPFVSLAAGIPFFYFACRWIGGRIRTGALRAAVALYVVYCAIEIPFMLTADNTALLFAAVSFPTKFLGAYLGGRAAGPRAQTA